LWANLARNVTKENWKRKRQGLESRESATEARIRGKKGTTSGLKKTRVVGRRTGSGGKVDRKKRGKRTIPKKKLMYETGGRA